MSLPYVVEHLEEIISEASKQVKRQAVKNFNKHYRSTIVTLNENRGGMTAERVSEKSGRSVETERKYLERFHDAGLLAKVGEVYKMTDENKEEMENLFGIKL